MTEKHYSNASFFGSVKLGKKEYQYFLPKEKANKPKSVIIDISGNGQNVTFDTIEQYIDINEVPGLDGVINFINNFNNYTEAGNNLFQNLSDVQGGINDYAGKFIIVNPNAPSNLTKVVYSNHTYNDVINSILDLQNRVSSLESSANGFHGKVEIIPSQRIYTINHEEVDEDTEYPIVSLQIPSSGSNIFIAGIYDRTDRSFKVEISDYVNESGKYYILWQIRLNRLFYNQYEVRIINDNNEQLLRGDGFIIISRDITSEINVILPNDPIKGKEIKIKNYSPNYNVRIKSPNISLYKINYESDVDYYFQLPRYRTASCIWTGNNEIGWSILLS